jgi:surfactin synthase thioesterase subunit
MTAAAEIADSIQHITSEPYALLGHSMGAILAFELARELRRRNLPAPQRLIVSACAAPDAPAPQEAIHQLADEEFLAEVHRRFQAVPREVADNEELKQLLLPILRADVRMFETYRFREEPPLEIDLLAIGGAEDSSVSAADLEHWRRHARGQFTARRFPGGHFFLFDSGGPRPTITPPLAWIFERLDQG